TPSELIKKEAVGEIDVHDFDTVSWADVKRSTDAWLGNDMQRTSFEAVKNLEPFVRATKNSVLLKIWRLLQTSDHIYYMYTEPGASGLVHGYFSQQFPTEAFWSFLRILSDFYMKVSENLSGRLKEAAKLLRVLPPDRAFHFHEDGRYIGLSAHSLEELKNALPYASETSILFHMACKHFEKWIRFTIGDSELADKISKAEGRSAAELRERIYELINRRILELKSVVE
ncbi:MAG: hypothetical protein QXH08_03770, partial [Candidatus Hadarchaeales archaeon]